MDVPHRSQDESYRRLFACAEELADLNKKIIDTARQQTEELDQLLRHNEECLTRCHQFLRQAGLDA